ARDHRVARVPRHLRHLRTAPSARRVQELRSPRTHRPRSGARRGLPQDALRNTMAVQTPIFMNYHSTTPVDPRVVDEMLPYFTKAFGNAASRNHVFGWAAEEAVEHARERVAKLLGAQSSKEIVFT